MWTINDLVHLLSIILRKTATNANVINQTDMIREQLVNVVEHLAAKEPDISLRSWWSPNTELKERGYWTL